MSPPMSSEASKHQPVLLWHVVQRWWLEASSAHACFCSAPVEGPLWAFPLAVLALALKTHLRTVPQHTKHVQQPSQGLGSVFTTRKHLIKHPHLSSVLFQRTHILLLQQTDNRSHRLSPSACRGKSAFLHHPSHCPVEDSGMRAYWALGVELEVQPTDANASIFYLLS